MPRTQVSTSLILENKYVLSFLPLLICEIPIAYLLEVSLTALDQSHTGH